MSRLKELADKLKGHLVIEKSLHYKGNQVDINHIDNKLSNGLDYEAAFERMVKKVEATK